jgi:transcriptional regulator with XRE-family HTH domain
MSINDRIKEIIEDLGVSYTRFAEEVGTVRSGISHVIRGRNKPGIDLLQKILSRYPSVNSQWLLTGKGEKYLTESETSVNESVPYKEQEEVLHTKQDSPGGAEKPKTPHLDSMQGSQKKIKKIVVMYSDGTYEELKP